MSKIISKPTLPSGGKDKVSDEQMARFIAGAPDAGRAAPSAAAPSADLLSSGGRKKPISLTIDGKILAQLDKKAAALGLSRAAAFALAVSRFIAAEEREANR